MFGSVTGCDIIILNFVDSYVDMLMEVDLMADFHVWFCDWL